jgi:hypothetical protein
VVTGEGRYFSAIGPAPQQESVLHRNADEKLSNKQYIVVSGTAERLATD